MSSKELISEAIKKCFEKSDKIDFFEVQKRKKFLESRIVKKWCDCTDNFEHEKLIKRFREFIKNL